LVRWLQAGNETAASRLYARYVARLRSLARAKLSADLTRRVDAEDIVQSVFRRFFHAARKGSYAAPAGEDLWNLLLVITLTLYQAANIYALTSRQEPADRERVTPLLAAALWSGFGLDIVDQDADMDPVRNQPGFRRLVEVVRELTAEAGRSPP
jgi:hypothetical protein